MDIADTRAVFEEVGSEAVAKGMDAYVFQYSDSIFSSGKDFLYRARAEVPSFLAFEEPCLGFVEVDIGFQEAFGPGGEDRIAVLPAFSAAYEDDAPGRIQVAYSKGGDFADAKAGGVGQDEEEPVLEVAGGRFTILTGLFSGEARRR